MTCINPPNPLFKGAHQGLRAFHRRTATLPASFGPASDDAFVNSLNPMFFIETLSQTAIPDNRCLTECDFIRENPPSSGQVVDFEQLIRKTPPVYGQT